MHTRIILKRLNNKYPGKITIENKNSVGVTTEIICELELTQDHPSWSRAIAVIDSSVIHYHQHIQETYTILKGTLTIFKYDRDKRQYAEYVIKTGQSIVIKPGEIHSNLGKETWVDVYSKPGWVVEDFINLETLLKKYTSRS